MVNLQPVGRLIPNISLRRSALSADSHKLGTADFGIQYGEQRGKKTALRETSANELGFCKGVLESVVQR